MAFWAKCLSIWDIDANVGLVTSWPPLSINDSDHEIHHVGPGRTGHEAIAQTLKKCVGVIVVQHRRGIESLLACSLDGSAVNERARRRRRPVRSIRPGGQKCNPV